MAKSVLVLDEINLFKRSEEIKNSELYGNLYEVLCQSDFHKAVSIDQLPLDEKGKAAVTYNKKTLSTNIAKEWYAEGVSDEDPTKTIKCGLCNRPNKYVYYIRNQKNNVLLNVGSRCIEKFSSDIGNWDDQKKKFADIQKGQKIIARRTEFYNAFPDCEEMISEAEEYFKNLPILLPYELYHKLQDTIISLRTIFSKYVNTGKNAIKSELSPIELFRDYLNQYEVLKKSAYDFVQKNSKKRLICKRREIDWLISHNHIEVLNQIANNNGKYTCDTIKHITSAEFLQDYLGLFSSKNKSSVFKFEGINENNAVFSMNKYGYNPPVIYTIALKDFMDHIGAYCLTDNNYSYRDKEINAVAKISESKQNLTSILDYIYAMVWKLNCAFLADDSTNTLYLYQRGNKSIRVFSPNTFLSAYSKKIMCDDEMIKEFLSQIVNVKNGKWVSLEQQEKQGINGKIANLYKGLKEVHPFNI